jgi:diguanylate cyclase (GGDEF)-like protein
MKYQRVIQWLFPVSAVATVAVLVSYHFGLFKVEADFAKPKNHVAVYSDADAHIQHSAKIQDDSIVFSCTVANHQAQNYCAGTILLSRSGSFTDMKEGVDLSTFENIDLTLEYYRPDNNPNLRLSFRTYDDNLTVDGDHTSLVYNSFIFEPFYTQQDISIPISALKLEDWWLTRLANQGKPLPEGTDISNVAMVEFVPHVISEDGSYTIVIKNLMLSGNIVSLSALLIGLATYWLVLGISLYCYYLLSNRAKVNVETISISEDGFGINRHEQLISWADSYMDASGSDTSATNIGILYFDLDNFAQLNAEYGLEQADHLLKNFSVGLSIFANNVFPDGHPFRLARLSGDEFALAFSIENDESGEGLIKWPAATITKTPVNCAEKLASLIINDIRRQQLMTLEEPKLTASIGVVESNGDGRDATTLLSQAQSAMMTAKSQGKAQYMVYQSSVENNLFLRREIAQDLKEALRDDAFSLVFMPIYALPYKPHDAPLFSKAEVLLRCTSGKLKHYLPSHYIPIAEEFDLIHEIDMWVLEQSFALLASDIATLSPDFVLSINVSNRELNYSGFLEEVKALVKRYDIDTARVELEITETHFTQFNENCIDTLKALRDLGFSLGLDDFGTGYTGFTELANYPISTLKIDKTFVDKILEDNTKSKTIINAMMSMVEDRKLTVVAEGVETLAQVDFLTQVGCDFAQGFLLSESLSKHEFIAQLRKQAA